MTKQDRKEVKQIVSTEIKKALTKSEKKMMSAMYHHTGLLSEEFQDRLRPVVELVVGLHDKLDENMRILTGITGNHEQRITLLEAK